MFGFVLVGECNMTLNVAVIGVGAMGKNHLRVYSELKDANITAICDSNKENLKIGEKYNIPTYTDYNKMFKNEKIDAVSLVVPTALHYQFSKKIIGKYKIPLLIEKPLCYKTREAEKLMSLSKRKKVFVTVGHIERFNPAVSTLKKDSKSILGRIYTLNSKRVGMAPPRRLDSGVILDLAVHDIDVMRYILGQKITEVFAYGKSVVSGGYKDYAFINLRFGNGILAAIEVNWITPTKIRKIYLTGENGLLETDYISQDVLFYEQQLSKGVGYRDLLGYEGVIKKIAVEKDEPLKLELNNFIRSVLGKEKPIITIKDGYEVVKIANAVIKSINKNKVIKIKK